MTDDEKISTSEHAHEIANKMLAILNADTAIIDFQENPVEHMLLIARTLGNFLAKIYIALDGYNETYGIDSLNIGVIQDYVQAITEEHINFYAGKMNKKSPL
jgi:hypothetical protein